MEMLEEEEEMGTTMRVEIQEKGRHRRLLILIKRNEKGNDGLRKRNRKLWKLSRCSYSNTISNSSRCRIIQLMEMEAEEGEEGD
jgi:hypothetical protein